MSLKINLPLFEEELSYYIMNKYSKKELQMLE